MSSKERPRGSDTPSEADTEAAGTPRWVKVFALIALAVIAFAVVLVLAGHDPGRHASGPPIPTVAASSSLQ